MPPGYDTLGDEIETTGYKELVNIPASATYFRAKLTILKKYPSSEQGNMSTEGIAILLAVFAGATWLWMRRARSEADEHSDSTSPYHCVAIEPREGACRTALTLKGQRFLSDEAPLLPLASCDVARCRCTFVHHKDRRRSDRRNPYTAQSHTFVVQGGVDRRGRRGRRNTDGMHMA